MTVTTIDTAQFRTAGLDDDEADRLGAMVDRIVAHQPRNQQLVELYEARNIVESLGISLPPTMRWLQAVVGWPAIAVDALDERLDLEGFAWPDGSIDALGVEEIVAENDLLTELGLAHLDAMIHGISFAAVSNGDTSKGEPEVLVTLEPPTRMTVEWDRRLRRASAAAAAEWDDAGMLANVSLYLPDETIHLVSEDGRWAVEDVQSHRLGRVPVVRLVNRPRGSRVWGATEITNPVVTYMEMACRSLMRMEVSAEFYSAPQRYAMGADPKDFVDESGNPVSGWQTVMGVLWAIARDEEGNVPEVGQFPAQSPAPHLEQVKGLASLFAAEAAIPVTYLGFHTQNPPGGDGIRATEARLVKRAERRQRVFGSGDAELIRLCLLVRDGELPDGASRIAPVWRDAATPTKAAAADRVLKMVSAGVFPADSEVTYEQLGLSQVDQARLASDARRLRTTQRIEALSKATGVSDPTVSEFATTEG